jgi:hypothetical protein
MAIFLVTASEGGEGKGPFTFQDQTGIQLQLTLNTVARRESQDAPAHPLNFLYYVRSQFQNYIRI